MMMPNSIRSTLTSTPLSKIVGQAQHFGERG